MSAAAMAADGLRTLGVDRVGDWEVAQLEGALASGACADLLGALGSTDLAASLGPRWRGPKAAHKRPAWGEIFCLFPMYLLVRPACTLPGAWSSVQQAFHCGVASMLCTLTCSILHACHGDVLQ